MNGDRGELLCDFVPAGTAYDILGGDNVEVRGELRSGQDGEPTNSTCEILTDSDSNTVSLSVALDYAEGYQREIEQRIESGAADHVYADEDLTPGMAMFRPRTDGADGQEIESFVIWGDYAITVKIREPAEGRDLVEDAATLTRGVAEALGLARGAATPSA